MIAFGEWAMWLAVALAAATTTLSFAGALRARAELVTLGRATTYAAFGATLLAVIGIWSALFARDLSLRYVAANTSLNLPRVYTLAALWAANQGVLLLWAFMLSACAAVAVFAHRRSTGTQMPWVTGTLGLLLLCLLVMLVVVANPYARLDWRPGEGLGMNPRLQVPAMLAQPVLLAQGLVATSVSFAFTVGALVTRRYDARWIGTVRRWSLLSWCLLTVSILLGFWWDYSTVEWSGRWSRDFARDSVLLPWLGVTTLLGTLAVHGDGAAVRRRAWVVTLALATFTLALLSAYVARSGMVDSVHAYAPSPVARGLLWMVAAVILLSIHLLRTRVGDLHAPIGSPAVVGADAGRDTRTYRAYAPLVAGTVALCVGFLGPAFRKEARVTLATGASVSATDAYGRTWTFTSQGISSYTELNREVLVLSVSVARDGRPTGRLTSAQRRFVDSDGNLMSKPITIVGRRSSASQDIRIAFVRAVDRGTAVIQIAFVPLVWWIWFGGFLVTIGGVIVMVSQRPGGDDDASRARASDEEVEAAIRRASAALHVCKQCGPRPEPDAVYCSNCGARLG